MFVMKWIVFGVLRKKLKVKIVEGEWMEEEKVWWARWRGIYICTLALTSSRYSNKKNMLYKLMMWLIIKQNVND